MNKNNRKVMMSVGLAILLVFSFMTTAMVGVAEEGVITADTDDERNELNAEFDTEEEYTLNVTKVGEGSVEIDPDQETYEPGTEVNLTAISAEQWYFVNWTGDYEGTEEEIKITMDANYTITAEFGEVDSVEITPSENFNLTAGYTENFSAEAYDSEGDLITDNVTEFEWTHIHDFNETTNVAIFDQAVAGDYNVSATYGEVTSENTTVAVEPADVDYVEIDPEEDQVIEAGDEVVFKAEAFDAYDNSITDDYRDFEWENASRGVFYLETVGEYNVTATYEGVTSEPTTVRVVEELYYLTINVEGEGVVEVDPDQDGYEENTNVTLTAISEDGWKFVEWTGAYQGTETEVTITMDDDKEITAVFEEERLEEHELTINIEGQGSTDPAEGTHTYEEGEEVIVEAIPADGWEFIEWTGDETSTDATITITMDEDKEITAVFEEEEPLEPYFEVEITAPDDGAEYEEGDTVTVEFTVTNTGDIVGTQDIVFSVDGAEVDRMEDVDVASTETYEGVFEWEADDEGDYQLEVASEDDKDSVEISVLEEDDEWWEIPGFTTMLLILGAVIAVAIYYKKEQ
ncbi:MAG: InlB B-repeat-containing protein [Candidatus Natronoplasma sp.]